MTPEKKTGIKRQITTDILGCLLSIVVHKADLHDTKMGIWAAGLAYMMYPQIETIYADGGYRKTFIRECVKYLNVGVEITGKINAKKFEVITPRWIVERTLAWLNYSRRLSKNYEYTTSSSETMVKISHIHTLLKRL
jgi:transposase